MVPVANDKHCFINHINDLGQEHRTGSVKHVNFVLGIGPLMNKDLLLHILSLPCCVSKASLPMLFQAVAVIGAMVWGYGELNGRISFLEYQVRINEEHIEAIEEDAKESQNAEIPADIRQNEKIRVLEEEVGRLRDEQRD